MPALPVRPFSAINVFAPVGLYSSVDDVERALEELYRSRYGRFEAVLATMTRDREAARVSYDEIAQACGVRRGTVAAALAQARAELSVIVDDPGGVIR